MYKSCSRCGKVHNTAFKCNYNRDKKDTEARRLRSKSKWQSKRAEIKKKSSYLCSVCREEGRYTYKGLEIHHITPIEEDKERVLDNYNLICLCQEHHKQAEIGKIDRDYLYLLASERESD